MRKLALAVAAAAVLGLFAGSAWATHGITGNGAPNGAHETLNLIGVDKGKNPNMNGGGSVIFVKLWGKTKILLCQSGTIGVCADEGFYVIDKNGTDGEAKFALPDPSGGADENAPDDSAYSVFVQERGKPGGEADMTTCATDDLGILVCSSQTLFLVRGNGSVPKFRNATKQLLYIYAFHNDALRRFPLFDDRLEDYYWDYENRGLRLASLRFYPCSTTVPGAGDPGGDINDNACFSGVH